MRIRYDPGHAYGEGRQAIPAFDLIRPWPRERVNPPGAVTEPSVDPRRVEWGPLTTRVVPVLAVMVIAVTALVAPAEERPVILLATLVAGAAGLASTAIGVYGGVLVPGLLLLGVDARFAAAASLFLQLLVIPLGAGAHYRLGNFDRGIARPLIVGGMIGAFVGPFFATALPRTSSRGWWRRSSSASGCGLATSAGGSRAGAPPVTSQRAVSAGIGLVAGFSSGISGAGWGLSVSICSSCPGSSHGWRGLVAVRRVFMAAAAVVGYLLSASAFDGVRPNYWLLIPLFAGSVAAMMPGAALVSRLGRERATVAITLLSIGLALPTLVWR